MTLGATAPCLWARVGGGLCEMAGAWVEPRGCDAGAHHAVPAGPRSIAW